MRYIKQTFITILITILLAACAEPQLPTSTSLPSIPDTPAKNDLKPAALLISEVMTGIDGNNLYDYIELYNAGDVPANLEGHSLWYQLKEDDEEILITRWNAPMLVPPHGHYLLGLTGQDYGIPLDAIFEQSLVPSRGGLALREGSDVTIDSVTWGDGPSHMAEGSAALEMKNGVALERNPGGNQGNHRDSDNNQTDFGLNPDPSPQNTGSPLTPQTGGGLSFEVDHPHLVIPGSTFEYMLHLENNTNQTLESITAYLTLPEALSPVEVTSNVTLSGYDVQWSVPSLDAGASLSTTLVVQAPWTFTDLAIHSSYAQAENWPTADFAGPLYTTVGGGAIPIRTARDLIGQEVVVEGTSTMYTGGFYAGSGAKFYIEDESAGIQIYVAGAGGVLNVPIGVRVRARGVIEVYRDSLELIPASIEQVEIIDSPQNVDEWHPTPVTLIEAANDSATLPGKLVEVEGKIARIEEFSYSYEVDLVDDEGHLLTCYVDKNTGITMESIEPQQQYRVTGIIEIFDGRQQLYPRLQSDFAEVYKPVLLVKADTPVSVAQDEPFTAAFTAYNHTPAIMTNVLITVELPDGFDIIDIDHDGQINGRTATWIVEELDGNGNSITVTLDATVTGNKQYTLISEYFVSSEQWDEPAKGMPIYIFHGDNIPIWAIQGSGFRSPYVLTTVQTEGVVTGVFPELNGFWIQELVSDDDPLTSGGIFVNTNDVAMPITTGDLVLVSGAVREAYQQTQIVISGSNDVEILSENNNLPIPVEINPPTDNDEAMIYFESLEGMLVRVDSPARVVGPTNRFGEYAVVTPTYDDDRVWHGDASGAVIRVDDGSSMVHEDRSTMTYPVAVGDEVFNLVGTLAFSFGQYKIEPTSPYEIFNQPVELPTLPPLDEGEFSIMTWNVENLFDFLDPHPSSPPLPTVSQYKTSITKVVQTLLSAGAPTIIGLQEVENIGVLEDIAGHDLLSEYGYQPVLIEGTDSRGIDVGYLVRTDRATVVQEEQFPAPEGITSRPPLLIEVELADGTTIFVLNNHFTSMSGGEEATEPRRTAQAAWNVQILNDLLAENPDAHIAMMGDLNSFYHSRPIDVLHEAGLRHVFELIEDQQPYTYVYQGVSQTLDHILVTPSLMAWIKQVEVLHINADYPLAFADDETPLHKSDHDPVIVIFTLP